MDNISSAGRNKKALIIAVIILLIVLVIAGYFYWSWLKKTSILRELEKNQAAEEKILESATKGVLPSLETNPLENKPDINPADSANPIKNIKTNPF